MFFLNDDYWLPKAWFYTQCPSLLVNAFFFPQKNSWGGWNEPGLAPDRVLLKIPFYVAACALMLISLPLDLLIGLVSLPPSILHDLFICINQCFEPSKEEDAFIPKF